MRIFRSRTNTKKTTPLSTSFRPALHDSAVRFVKSSSEGVGSSGKTATRTWFEVCFSKSRSFASSRRPSSGGTRPA